MIVLKEFTFDSAHQLMNYSGGKCEDLHGHTYKLQVFVKGKMQEDGLLLDFDILKSLVKQHVLNVLDHKYLNDIIKQPSAENISIWIWKKLADKLPLPLYEVRVWETPTQAAICQGDKEELNQSI